LDRCYQKATAKTRTFSRPPEEKWGTKRHAHASAGGDVYLGAFAYVLGADGCRRIAGQSDVTLEGVTALRRHAAAHAHREAEGRAA
jgi:hypothetical protein